MDNEDEEVVFKNSALYDHLVSSGFSEFESASCLDDAAARSAQLTESTQEKSSGQVRPLLDRLASAADWLSVRSTPLMAPRALPLLFYSGLMTDRDRAAAADLCCPPPVPPSAPTSPPTVLLLLAVVVGVASVASATYMPARWLLLPPLVVAAVVGGAAVARRHRAAAQLRRVTLFCDAALQLRRTALKSARLLQEAHLMARGLTLSGGGCGAQAAFAAQYGALLRVCGDCLRTCCGAYAAGTRRLRRERPLLDGVDPQQHYVAYEEPALLAATGQQVTVKDVKMLHQLLVDLQSELVRRCCLGLSADLLPPGAGPPSIASGVLSRLTSTLVDQQRRLSAAHRAHAARWEEPVAALRGPASSTPQQPAERLYVGVHSVCLEAQVVALRARALESLLTGEPDAEEGGGDAAPPDLDADGAVSGRVRSELEEMRRRLEAGALLCDQTLLQLSRLCDSPPPAVLSPPAHTQTTSPAALPELPEPEIIDQFFEAVVEGSDAAQPEEEDDFVSQEERLQRRLHRERARELLRELDGALDAKRREWRQREAAARGELPPVESAHVSPSPQSSDVSLSPAAVAAAARGAAAVSSTLAELRLPASQLTPPSNTTCGRNIPDDYKIDPSELYRFSDSDEPDGTGVGAEPEQEAPVLPPGGDLAHLLPVRRRARPAAGRRLPSRPASLAGTPLRPDPAGSGDAGQDTLNRAWNPRYVTEASPPAVETSPSVPSPPSAGIHQRRTAASLGLPARMGFPAELSAQAAALAQQRRGRQASAEEEVFGSDSD